MESRKITVFSTRTQSKHVIMSSASTLRELKNDLRSHGINYTDMSFLEGLTKTELKTDDSLLPHDVPYKGTTTNELVFMLTNTAKKIRSGAMSRSEAYAQIKKLNLQDTCKTKFGKNFTQCSTNDLISLIEGASSTKEETPKVKEEKPKTETPKPVEEAPKEAPAPTINTHDLVDKAARRAIASLVEALYDGDFIDDGDREEIYSILDNDTSTVEGEKSGVTNRKESDNSPYSDSEIDDMFSDFR